MPSYNLAFLPHFQTMSEEEFQALLGLAKAGIGRLVELQKLAIL